MVKYNTYGDIYVHMLCYWAVVIGAVEHVINTKINLKIIVVINLRKR